MIEAPHPLDRHRIDERSGLRIDLEHISVPLAHERRAVVVHRILVARHVRALLAREPRTPRCASPGAVAPGARQARERLDDVAIGIDPQRGRAALGELVVRTHAPGIDHVVAAQVDLVVAHQNRHAALARERRHAVVQRRHRLARAELLAEALVCRLTEQCGREHAVFEARRQVEHRCGIRHQRPVARRRCRVREAREQQIEPGRRQQSRTCGDAGAEKASSCQPHQRHLSAGWISSAVLDSSLPCPTRPELRS